MYDETWRPAFPPEPEPVDLTKLTLFMGGVLEHRDGKSFLVPLERYTRPHDDWIGHQYLFAFPRPDQEQLAAMEEDPIIVTHGDDWDLDPGEVYLIGRARGFVAGFERGLARGQRNGSEETAREYQVQLLALARKWKRGTIGAVGAAAAILAASLLWALM